MADRIERSWLWFVSLLSAPVMLLSFRSYVVVVAAFALPAVLRMECFRRTRPWPLWFWALAALVLYSAFSAWWSPLGDPLSYAWSLPVVFAVASLLLTGKPQPVDIFAGGAGLALLLLFLDAVTGNLIRDVLPPDNRPDKDAVAAGRGLGLLLFLMPMLTLWAWRQFGRNGFVVVTVYLLAALYTPIEINVVATFGAVLIGLAAWRSVRWGLRLLAVYAGLALSVPFLLAVMLPSVPVLLEVRSLPLSVLHRLVIWRTVLDDWIGGHIVFGAGARATRALSQATGNVVLAEANHQVALVSVHPHNVFIEVLYEYGLLGYSLLLAAFVLAVRLLLRMPLSRPLGAGVAALGFIIITIFSMETTLWNAYTLSAAVLGAFSLQSLAAESRWT
ncbi:MAG: hypothetical protein AAF788_03075 [Pseudomonadota bacterium]